MTILSVFTLAGPRTVRLLVFSVAALFLVAGCKKAGTAGGGNPKVPAGAKSSGGKHAVIETDKGTIEIELLTVESPKAVENFRLLAEHGYYDGLTFHRIAKGFMIQGGDPNGDGTGGQSAWGGKFPDDINVGTDLYKAGYKRGIVAMANAGRDTNGSQFFIMDADTPLPARDYTIFGKLTEGQDVVNQIAAAPRNRSDRPDQPVVINSVTITEQ